MRAVRFGSYSMAATLAGTPSFSRRQSMMRYRRLWPPPTWRVVMWPCALRPPVRFIGRVSFFSGFALVISAKSETVLWRYVGLLPVVPAADVAAVALVLPARYGGAHVEHVNVEQLLRRLLHLDLGRVAVDLEGERVARLAVALGLLGDERA